MMLPVANIDVSLNEDLEHGLQAFRESLPVPSRTVSQELSDLWVRVDNLARHVEHVSKAARHST